MSDHLLEVWYKPPGVHRVPVERAAQVIAHASGCHPTQGVHHHGQGRRGAGAGVMPQQDLEGDRLRELRCRTEASLGRVITAFESRDRSVDEFETGGRSARSRITPLSERIEESGASGEDLVPSVFPGIVDRSEEIGERWYPRPRFWRVVRTPEERDAIWCQEDGHRPATASRHRLNRLHVDLVNVGPLFAIHLDVHEELVHQRRDRRIFEGLALHHVTPVAGGIAHREEDRPLLCLRARQRLGSPGIPFDRVLRVLQKVGAGLGREVVGHGWQGT